METELTTFINSHTKEQILAILDFFGQRINRSMRKSELGKKLNSFLSDDPRCWLEMLLESDLKLLYRLCKAGAGVKMTLIRPDYRSVVEILHFVDVWDLGEEEMEVSIGQPIYNLVSPHIDRVINVKESNGSFDIERMIFGCLNIYGVVPLKTFIDKIFEEDFPDIDPFELTINVAISPLLKLYREEYKGEIYLISPFVENFEEILEMRRMTFREARRYAKMTKNSAIACGSFAPNCVWGLETEEGQKLIEMLESLGYSGDELEFQLHSVWVSSQYAIDEDATEVLFRPVTEKQEGISSFREFLDCIETVVNYSNSVPKWLLKGMSSNQSGMMKLAVRTEDLEEEYSGPLEVDNLPAELEQFCSLGMMVRPTNPFSPCPCGSGISYCNCHGRKTRQS